MKSYIALGVLVVVGAVGMIALHRPEARAPITQIKQEVVRPVTITFVGDMMLDRGVKRSVENNFKGDYSALFTNTQYLTDSDITFGNLEGTVTDEFSKRTGSRFSFRMDPKVLPVLKDTGFDIVSFANNHVGDYSTKGFLKTIENLKANNLAYTGAGVDYTEVVTPKIIEVRGIKVGFLGATDVGPDWLAATNTKSGILLANDPKLPEIIAAAKAQVDILIMSFHWGNEYSPATSRQEKYAHASIDAGADIVVGHHPHVMERVEEYNGKLIYYSLGNYIFDQYFSPHTMRGMVAKVTIDPTTRAITHTEEVSPLNRQFVPQSLIPFDTSMLVTKTFTP